MIAIMQPYFFPYIGYFQLMNAVDEFIVYDNIQFSKKGWINRNRILVNGKDLFITIPLRKDSDYLHIQDRYLAEAWPIERKKMLNKIIENYRKAPYFPKVFPMIEGCILFEEPNLFQFVYNTIKNVTEYLNIQTKVTISSTIPIDHGLKSEEKVISICVNKNATNYVNPIGGLDLYSKDRFESKGITLQFLKTNEIVYSQFKNEFIPFLSIIDVIMFNSKNDVNSMLRSYTLI
ncbi:MAG: WbqC family protein [Cyclobacteriaceae bacterium]